MKGRVRQWGALKFLCLSTACPYLLAAVFKFRSGTITACRTEFGSTAFTSKPNFWAIRVKDAHATYTYTEPVAPVAYLVILEPGIGQFREFESPRVHTRINS